MEWTMSFLSNEGIVVIETCGLADGESTLKMAESIRGYMRKQKSKSCLIDHTQVISVTGKMADIYDRPRTFFGFQMPIKLKIAEVVLPEHREFFRFLETVSLNRGFRFQIFDNRESALKWLMEA